MFEEKWRKAIRYLRNFNKANYRLSFFTEGKVLGEKRFPPTYMNSFRVSKWVWLKLFQVYIAYFQGDVLQKNVLPQLQTHSFSQQKVLCQNSAGCWGKRIRIKISFQLYNEGKNDRPRLHRVMLFWGKNGVDTFLKPFILSK